MPQPNRTTLALDPGLRELGYAVLRGSELLDHGVLALRHLPDAGRLRQIREKIEALHRAHQFEILVHEDIPKRPLDSLAGLPALGRLLRRRAKAHGLDIATYSAKAVRRTIVGNGWAGKPEVADALIARFAQLKVYRTQNRKWKDRYWQNMFDALALAVYHHALTQPPSRSR